MSGEPRTTGFSLVVVIHNSALELRRLLASLERHLAAGVELVVVDNGSSDEGPELARQAGAHVLGLADNPGFGAGANAGVARVTAPVTVLLNPDVELLDSGLVRLADQALRRRALVAPRLFYSDGRAQDSVHPLPGRLGGVLCAPVPPAALLPALRRWAQPWRASSPRQVGWAIAACLAAPTEVLRALGPFDPEAFLFYEDLDLCLRARSIGVATLFDPSVALIHRGAHATERYFPGVPYELLAHRRRAVVGDVLGTRARRRDDLAQALTFASRIALKGLLRRPTWVERERLRALRATRRKQGNPARSPAQNSPS